MGYRPEAVAAASTAETGTEEPEPDSCRVDTTGTFLRTRFLYCQYKISKRRRHCLNIHAEDGIFFSIIANKYFLYFSVEGDCWRIPVLPVLR